MNEGRSFYLVGLSPAVSPAQLGRIAAACVLQVARDAAPAWGLLPITITPVASLDEVPPDGFLVAVLVDPDLAGADGYHSEAPDGRAYARVFTAGQTLDEISVAISHELLEPLEDQSVNRWADDGRGTLYAVEISDPVEGDTYGIDLGDGQPPVMVSNFVTPAWFDPWAPADARFDHLGMLRAPFELRTENGGYAVVMSNGKRSTLPASAAMTEGKRHPAARTARRLRS